MSRVVAICGWGRSGSTFLAGAMGGATGFVALGEVDRVWDRGLLYDERCSCGEPFHACPLWSEVVACLPSELCRPDVARKLAEYRRSTEHLLRSRMSRHGRTGRAYTEATRSLVAAISSVLGATGWIDGSKTPAHVDLMAREVVPGIRIFHLVRAPADVAASWGVARPRPEATDISTQQSTTVIGGRKALALWVLRNVEAAVVLRGRVGMRVQYEELGSPVVQQSLIDMCIDEATAKYSDRASTSHLVSGNPSGPAAAFADFAPTAGAVAPRSARIAGRMFGYR